MPFADSGLAHFWLFFYTNPCRPSSQSIARLWAADIRSQSSSGDHSTPHRNRGVCVLPIDAGQLLRSPGDQRRRLFSVFVGGCCTQRPTRSSCGHVGAHAWRDA
ncbi:hypothetical protein XAP3CFBP6996_015795 [Xanthomonas citri pv. fuscans CFBP 6996]|nr:hypothetical protein XAP3CFBP6996_015795 [Xanthomonas citri pv. fuscans CFBP 6996]QWN17147.1 hypothetical protein DGN02_16090 [Xanthomonas citri]